MNYPDHVWKQLKNISCDHLIKALLADGAEKDISRGASLVFRYSDGRRITVHYHPNKTYQPGLLKSLLGDIGWSVEDLRRVRLIK